MRVLFGFLLLVLPSFAALDDEAEYAAFMEQTTPLAGTTPAQWRVIWTEDPAHRATIGWTTLLKGSSHEVRWGTTAQGDDIAGYKNTLAAARNGSYSLSEKEVESGTTAPFFHVARLVDLPAAATIWFRLVSDGVASREFHFRTADDDATNIAFLAGGDSRSGHLDRCRLNAQLAQRIAEDPDLLAFSHGGDYVFDGKTWRLWALWLSQFELMTAADGRVLPIIPVRGNHDVGPLYGQIFDAPGAPNPHYWTTRIGPLALVNLNTEISAAGVQAGWLQDQLRSLRKMSGWLVPNYHRALFPAVKQPGAAKAHWVPLFDRNRVDLVLESDGHVFKRTVPIRKGKRNKRGVVYMGEGGLGVPQRKPRRNAWYLEKPGYAASAHHVMRVEAGVDELNVTTLAMGELAVEFEPEDVNPFLARGAVASYLLDDELSEDWTAPRFNDSRWASGPGGFGFGDDDDTTVLAEMHERHARLHVRYDLKESDLRKLKRLGIAARFDDGFIAYLNGTEIARAGVESGSGASAEGIANHEATRWEYFALADWRSLIVKGTNVFAVEGHNRGKSSSDFTLDVTLVRGVPPVPPAAREGLWILDETTILPHEVRWAPRRR